MHTAKAFAWGSNIDILNDTIFADVGNMPVKYDKEIVESIIAIKEYIVPTVQSAASKEDLREKILRKIKSVLSK